MAEKTVRVCDRCGTTKKVYAVVIEVTTEDDGGTIASEPLRRDLCERHMLRLNDVIVTATAPLRKAAQAKE